MNAFKQVPTVQTSCGPVFAFNETLAYRQGFIAASFFGEGWIESRKPETIESLPPEFWRGFGDAMARKHNENTLDCVYDRIPV